MSERRVPLPWPSIVLVVFIQAGGLQLLANSFIAGLSAWACLMIGMM
ncbi:hypothetical protein P1S61_13300 [Streptomyces sp. ME08-AFT2]|nr:hypothetical protein [Streptomyces sp. ME08-AFT2]MDX3310045.1 hypothetical protein [Streptomyces sp. ME08-AFT2]